MPYGYTEANKELELWTLARMWLLLWTMMYKSGSQKVRGWGLLVLIQMAKVEVSRNCRSEET